MKDTLEGKRCIVTGGGSGIGRGIALSLAAAGARLAVTGRREEMLRETADQIRETGGHASIQVMDVTDADAVAHGFERILGTLEGLDVLVNNAGLGGPNACAVGGPERWDEIVRTNLDGVYHCSRAAAPALTEGGSIINISSVLGRFGVPGYTAYCASKHGVIGFTKALALELAPRRIRANAICPGWVETDMAKDGMEGLAKAMGTTYEEARRHALSEVPLGRILEVDEIGELVVYLASPAASGMTGQAISLCGGQTMW
jgi:NAD(P)-dependent dehydrogenase (short-subunit alcohol dehydrogenase family)